ncbi:leucine-rich repeat protein SHOC-2 [Cylas formicarius]|uniref:leucine-rich repeat protein SHOC-2 n=1 Tax=Cylas formicarius TaxID=197179 RepID=UPI002958684A|nr:leucine-rich repeat protein SHOC-2 [Cylas formicarius]
MTKLGRSMSALLLTIVGISAFQQCPVWREIAPCACRRSQAKLSSITCDKMGSYGQVVNLLGGHFGPTDRVSLKLSSSNLQDLEYRAFKELNVSIENLKLNHDHIGEINEQAFEGLNKVNYLSLADTTLERVPEKLWKKMPAIKTLDLGRTKITEITLSNFKDLPNLECLVVPGNQISRLDKGSIPARVQRLHLGRNKLRHLNHTLVGLKDLGWLFVNTNELEDLEDQLPSEAPDLKLIHASQNRIKRLPQQLKNYPALDSLFFQHNALISLEGALTKSKELVRLVLEYNNINMITKDDFQELEMLESLLLGHNHITTLNNSLIGLRNLNFLNMTFNRLTEFSFQDVVGLQELRSMDLSFNQITNIIGPAANLVEWDIKLTELKLDHNLLETLNGALSGLPELLRLNLSFNKLRRISPDDFIGLDQLRLLDISNNLLTTLEETSRTFLPRLSELRASHNNLTVLEKDFHGLPVLCHADLSSNQIVALGRDLVTKTRCKIEHGVHEGTWDTLKIYLQDNPILCDAALPEIMSAMEINHTRIYGVSHCPPLSEQPVTSKPNGFLGYIPETDAQLETQDHDFDAKTLTNVLDSTNQLQPKLHPESLGVANVEFHSSQKYSIEHLEGITPEMRIHHDQPIALTLQPLNIANSTSDSNDLRNSTNFDPITQGQQITKLASEIEELRSRIDQLSTQNELLLNKTILEQKELLQRSPKEGDSRKT